MGGAEREKEREGRRERDAEKKNEREAPQKAMWRVADHCYTIEVKNIVHSIFIGTRHFLLVDGFSFG